MGTSKLVYQEWIVTLGRDPARSWQEAACVRPSYDDEAILAVTEALEMLSEEEAALIRDFHFRGLSYEDISRTTGREIYRLELLHRRALRSLTVRLRPWFESKDARTGHPQSTCLLCRHPARKEIDHLLHSKRREETWKRIITILRETYKAPIRSPQQIIGHLKYHQPAHKDAVRQPPGSGESIA
jgi:hypothetical protein